jgi:hypothetical protein
MFYNNFEHIKVVLVKTSYYSEPSAKTQNHAFAGLKIAPSQRRPMSPSPWGFFLPALSSQQH